MYPAQRFNVPFIPTAIDSIPCLTYEQNGHVNLLELTPFDANFLDSLGISYSRYTFQPVSTNVYGSVLKKSFFIHEKMFWLSTLVSELETTGYRLTRTQYDEFLRDLLLTDVCSNRQLDYVSEELCWNGYE